MKKDRRDDHADDSHHHTAARRVVACHGLRAMKMPNPAIASPPIRDHVQNQANHVFCSLRSVRTTQMLSGGDRRPRENSRSIVHYTRSVRTVADFTLTSRR